MKKVLILAPTPPPAGGIAGWAERMKNVSLKDNWCVEIVDEKQLGDRKLFSSNIIKRNIISEFKRCIRIWGDLRRKLVDKNDEDIIVVHSCIPSTTFAMLREYVCAYISHKHNTKFIVHFRCTVPNTTKGKIGTFILKKLCDYSDYIIVLNKQSKDFIDRITKKPNSIIPNFIVFSEVSCQFCVREKIKKVIYVGGVIETKGAIEAFELAKRFLDIEFEFVGEIPIENRLIAETIPNITLTGALSHENVKQHLMNADVFLFPTHFYGEGFSNALCEAMGVGLPCLVTNWAANSDMIDNSKGGFVVPIHDVDQLENALNNMKDRIIREKMSAHNRMKASQLYSQNVVVDKYVDVYESIVG